MFGLASSPKQFIRENTLTNTTTSQLLYGNPAIFCGCPQWTEKNSLQHAHNFRIVHRDLKPENILLVKNADRSERAVIMDFGLAKEQRDYAELRKLTKTGTIIGTPEFISPEQIRREPVDGRTDVYSLAIMAFELVSGELPFPVSSPNETLMAHLAGEPAPLGKFRPDLPASLEQTLAKGMALAPDDRYDTALDFAHALRGTLTVG